MKLHCKITKNLCGTDTWNLDAPCKCENCQMWIMGRLCETSVKLDEARCLHSSLRAENARLREALEYFTGTEWATEKISKVREIAIQALKKASQ